MSVRSGTPINALLDAVVETLKGIAKKKSPLYLTSPKDVKRLLIAGDFSGKEKPFLAVSFIDWNVTPMPGQRFDGVLRFGVHCVSSSLDNASEKAVLDLVSDVLLALGEDVTLGSQAFYCFPQSFEADVELMRRSGLAVATITFETLYRYDWNRS